MQSINEFITTHPFQFTHPIDEQIFIDWKDQHMANFDSSGYEMTVLEQCYAKANGIETDNCALGHNTISKQWIDQSQFNSYKQIIVDHSFVSIRCEFAGAATQQLCRWVDRYPVLLKLLRIKPKFGADLSLEVLDQNQYFELLHIEKDVLLSERRELLSWIDVVERKIKSTRWDMAIDHLSQLRFGHLNADDQSDTKARLFGFTRTYDTLKPIL